MSPVSTRSTGLAFAALACLIAAANPAHAASPYATDDARLIDAKGCQLETWVRTNRGSTEYWALPACNFTGKMDLTLGAARVREDGSMRTTDVQLQAKTVFKPMEPDGWGIGLVVGTVRHPVIGSRDWYVNMPVSFSFRDDQWVVHVNGGVVRDGEAGRNRTAWGTAIESRLAEGTWLIGEVFGHSNTGRPLFQAGVRHSLVPNRIQIDATYGNRLGGGGDERWFSIGLRLLTPAFLP